MPYKLHRLQPKRKADTRLACDLDVLWCMITVMAVTFPKFHVALAVRDLHYHF